MANRVIVLEHDFSGWIRTATFEEITALLHIIGRELLTGRVVAGDIAPTAKPIERAGVLAWQAAELLYNCAGRAISAASEQQDSAKLRAWHHFLAGGRTERPRHGSSEETKI